MEEAYKPKSGSSEAGEPPKGGSNVQSPDDSLRLMIEHAGELQQELGKIKGFVAFNFRDFLAEDRDIAETLIAILSTIRPCRVPTFADVSVCECDPEPEAEWLTKIPRRSRLDKHTPAELAVRHAIWAVERARGSPNLTDVVVTLLAAFEKLANETDKPEGEAKV